MNSPNTTRYTNTAISLHWLVALLIFAAFPLGVYMHELSSSPTKLQLYSYHKWLGITVLLLAVLRVVRYAHTAGTARRHAALAANCQPCHAPTFVCAALCGTSVRLVNEFGQRLQDSVVRPAAAA